MRSMRLGEKWTLEHVAKEIGTSKQTIQRIETRKRNPSFKLIVALQHLYNEPIDYLLEQVAEMHEELLELPSKSSYSP